MRRCINMQTHTSLLSLKRRGGSPSHRGPRISTGSAVTNPVPFTFRDQHQTIQTRMGTRDGSFVCVYSERDKNRSKGYVRLDWRMALPVHCWGVQVLRRMGWRWLAPVGEMVIPSITEAEIAVISFPK